jgi:hypothetical protein
MKIRLSLLFLILSYSCLVYGQQGGKEEKALVQFSGVVVTADSLRPIPFVNIMIRDSWRGVISDLYGFFSIVASRGDVILFSAMGYKTAAYTIPDTLSTDRYSLIQLMRPDTLILNETVIYPWPTYEQFKTAFVNANIPDDDMERARKNIQKMEREIATGSWAMDGSMNYRNYIEKQTGRLYYAGQLPPNNLLNPFAWAQFIKAWRDGKFKMKRDED